MFKIFSLEKFILEADILTFHVPLVFDGLYSIWYMVGIDFFESLGDNVILINAFRGAVIDNLALLYILLSGKNKCCFRCFRR